MIFYVPLQIDALAHLFQRTLLAEPRNTAPRNRGTFYVGSTVRFWPVAAGWWKSEQFLGRESGVDPI